LPLHQELDREADLLGLWRMPRAKARDRLIQHYWEFAQMLGHQAARRNSQIDADDAVSEATIALIQAIDKFDPQNANGATFTTYASLRINGGATEAERANDWVNHKVRAADKQLRERIAQGEDVGNQRPLPMMRSIEKKDGGFIDVPEDEPDDAPAPEAQLHALLAQADPVTRFFAQGITEHGLYSDELPELWGVSVELAGRLNRWTLERLRDVPVAVA
jgi:RNA polymerase sigma factor (sigma-70 family)